jgi:hypothetical protein
MYVVETIESALLWKLAVPKVSMPLSLESIFCKSCRVCVQLPEGSKVEIPFWLAERMVKRGILTIDLPKFYGPEYRGKLKAGPTAVALSDWSPSYYHLGVKLSKLSDAVNIDFEVREELINLLPLLRHVWPRLRIIEYSPKRRCLAHSSQPATFRDRVVRV